MKIILYLVAIPLLELFTLFSISHIISFSIAIVLSIVLGIFILNCILLYFISIFFYKKQLLMNLYVLLLNSIFLLSFFDALGTIDFSVIPFGFWHVILGGNALETFVCGIFGIPIYFVYLIIMLNISCLYLKHSLKYNFKNQKIEMNLKIHTIREIETCTYKVKGKLQVKNLTENISLFDLRNIELRTEDNIDYKIYIDSIATRLIEVQEIKPHEIYIENVYWIVHSDKKLLIKELDYSN